MAAAIAAERIAILLGKYVCEEVGLFEFVRQNPDILERKLIDGKNLLHLAVQADDLGLVQKILDGGFVKVINDPDDNKYWTPLSYAAFQKNLKLVNLLLEAGANPSNGAPLLFACQYDEPCAARLIEAGADVNDFYAETHETCLHAAVRGNNLWIIHQLLRHGADPTRRDARDMTPADLAAELDNPDLSAMLRKAEATWPEFQQKLAKQRQIVSETRGEKLLKQFMGSETSAALEKAGIKMDPSFKGKRLTTYMKEDLRPVDVSSPRKRNDYQAAVNLKKL